MSKQTIEGELNRTGKILRTTIGTSMQPMLKERENIVVLEKAESVLKKYDIALYKRPNGQYVLHRVLKVRENDYIICGDNLWQKEIVPHKWVLAYATGYYKDGNFISVNDKDYCRYLKTLGIRRKRLWIKSVIKRFFNEK